MEKRRSTWALTWVPRPRIKRPSERLWRSQAVWAVSIGEREKAIATEVPSSMPSVAPAATASGRKASCLVSLVHRPAKPKSSAARAVRSIPLR